MKTENKKLRQEVENLQQYTRRNNVVISGIKYEEGENLFELIRKCADDVNVKIEPQDIDIAHRLPKRRDTSEPPVILVKFVRRTLKHQLMSLWKANRSKKQSGTPTPKETVYINDHLTQKSAHLLRKAKECRNRGELKYVWTKDGGVYVRREENEKAVRVQCETDIFKASTARTNATSTR